ncbi:hypothetical protein [Rubinisphaera italica]|uniref:Uncharacterized protein n=1 Tax=Rubinisphaera italica TaxID=2527969 RepID=A0A5C5XFD5_9PLAN|nr:hypothetical protein [Rubinisphaera italica]TWT61504.1 hypothetical protein Pan54_22400 [Rubinisphaera italica]
MRLHRFQLLISLFLVTFPLLGCGGSDYEGPSRAAVSGTITLNGESIENGTISFQPRSSSNRAAGAIIVGGQYEISEGKGPNMGVYDVIISSIINEEEVPVIDSGEDTGETEMVGEQIIPSKYNEDTELKVTVDKSSHQFDFNLDSE